jgi:hypothetical protein
MKGYQQPIFISGVWEEPDIRLETYYQGINQEKTTGNILDRTRGEKPYVVDIPYVCEERKKEKKRMTKRE